MTRLRTSRRSRMGVGLLALLTTAAGLGVLVQGNRADVAAARMLKLGMTQAEVVQIVGDGPHQFNYIADTSTGLLRGATYSRWYQRAQDEPS